MSHPSPTCSICKKPILEGEDKVFCPSCGAPYHRECYLREGKCVYTGQHASGFEYKDPAEKTGYAPNIQAPESAGRGVVCKSCSTVNDARNIFCEKCGAPLHATASNAASGGQLGQNPGTSPFGAAGQQQAGPFTGRPFGGAGGPYAAYPLDLSGEIDGISKRDWAAYIGTGAPGYIARMSAQQARGSKFSFMLSAFFLGPFYFAYRKMWKWALLSLLALVVLMIPGNLIIMQEMKNPLVAGFSADLLDTLSFISNYVSFGVQILCGVFSLYLYRLHAGKKIAELRTVHKLDADYQNALLVKGGVSALGVLAVFGLLFAVSGVMYAVMGPDLLTYYSTQLGMPLTL